MGFHYILNPPRIVASGVYLERFTNFSKTKLNMVYNTLKKIFL